MTALEQYERLESLGLWRATRSEQRREVLVSFGKATLIVSDMADRPLTHWSLPAVERVNPDAMPAVFRPGPDAGESLEIEDETMVDAIEAVRDSIARAEAKPGRLRYWISAAILTAIIGAGAVWGPGLLRDQALLATPDARRAELGARILGHMQAQTGAICRSRGGLVALDRMRARLLGPDAPGQTVVLPAPLPGPVLLPGQITVINRAVLVRYDDPAVVAGEILAAKANTTDPLRAVLNFAGLRATVHLMTTGDLPPGTLADYAASLIEKPQAVTSEQALLQAFASVGVPSAPYADLRTARGQNAALLLTQSPDTGTPPSPILTDSEWIQLQGICDA
ncbi:hypothetical protein SAMN05428995_105309 [Loktanella sp. DSM 29012]|uniref:hypothetical protein n=1 Tax=Loktanella sp. DSM 29012 TaxID=1881056 RepID=UPI0008B3134F|nr:hypothetical protein [Loktanella sp. DSM 29012]SEQ61527.1 hypothetical protein SAMN05428995_105309 [Loktanella sp. DSM 29012]